MPEMRTLLEFSVVSVRSVLKASPSCHHFHASRSSSGTHVLSLKSIGFFVLCRTWTHPARILDNQRCCQTYAVCHGSTWSSASSGSPTTDVLTSPCVFVTPPWSRMAPGFPLTRAHTVQPLRTSFSVPIAKTTNVTSVKLRDKNPRAFSLHMCSGDHSCPRTTECCRLNRCARVHTAITSSHTCLLYTSPSPRD